jgi:hypothetical protein
MDIICSTYGEIINSYKISKRKYEGRTSLLGGGGRERKRGLVDEIIILRWILEKCDVAGLRKFTFFRI